METFAALLALRAGNSPVWRGALMFSLICAWLKGWVNNREAGDLRHHRAHYDVTVMKVLEFHDQRFQIEHVAWPPLYYRGTLSTVYSQSNSFEDRVSVDFIYGYPTFKWIPVTSLKIWQLMMTSSNGNIFRVTGPLCGEFSGHQWIPLTKASDAELWCFLWSAPE